MPRHPGRLVPLLVLGLLAFAGPTGRAAAVPAETLIQPGARMTAPAGCTLNFVFSDGVGRRYIGTAGHCVGGVGDVVADARGQRIGTVVFSRFVGVGVDDFALIRVDAARVPEVQPSMRHWGGPTGYTVSAETERGEPILEYGYGMGFGTTALTRPRVGALTGDNSTTWHAAIPIIFGDSGGPVLFGPTGDALGVVSGITGTGLFVGTTIQRVLVLLDAAGLDVQLVTAAYSFP